MNYDSNMNNYSNYYSQPNYSQQNFQPRPIMNQYVFVNGIDGAKSFQLPPNQTILLMDNDNPYAYMKSSNQIGQTSIRYFKLVETTEQELRNSNNVEVVSNDYVSRSEFDEMKKKIDKILKGE